MKPASQILIEQALALPEDERLEIATLLLASVEDAVDAEWECHWLEELERRRQAAEKDPSSISEWAAARARILTRLGRVQ